MFGIGKDQESEKEMDKVEKNREEDEIPLDSEAGEKRPFDNDDDDFAEEDFAEEDETDRRTASSRSIILLVLLLLLALGGGYYYLNSTPAPVQPLASAPVKVKVQPEAAVPAMAPEPEAAAVAAPTVPVAPADAVVIPVGGSRWRHRCQRSLGPLPSPPAPFLARNISTTLRRGFVVSVIPRRWKRPTVWCR